MNLLPNSELYVDKDKKSFKDLDYKRLGVLSLMPALVAKVARKAVQKVRLCSIGYTSIGFLPFHFIFIVPNPLVVRIAEMPHD